MPSISIACFHWKICGRISAPDKFIPDEENVRIGRTLLPGVQHPDEFLNHLHFLGIAL